MKRWLSEPMLHFFVAGAALFAAYSYAAGGRADGAADRVVHIGPDEVNWLRETWVRQWQREPTSGELGGLATEFLKEELLVREARALGLDVDDTIVRRRLAQKLEFIVEDTARVAEPSADELTRYYDDHPELFSAPARISFSQVYFSREQREDPAADAAAALSTLTRGPATVAASALGDNLIVASAWTDVDEATVAAQFGADFAKAVFALAPGSWHGPLDSAYGLHLVRVDRTRPAALRDFAQVAPQVQERWRADRERELRERYFVTLMDKYDVRIDAAVAPLLGPLTQTMVGPTLADAESR